MSSADDLVTVLVGDKQPEVGFRQGVIQSWNANTGQNVIAVGGTFLTDVAILNTGEAVALKAGHVVGLLTMAGSWFILGRITPPNDPNFAAASVAFGSAGAQVFNFSTSTSLVIKATSNELVVPDWADEALVLVTGSCGVRNSTAATDALGFEVGCFGGTGGAPASDAPAGTWVSMSGSSRNHFTGLSGGEVLQITGAVVTSNAGWAANPVNSLFLHAIAIYKSNV